MYDTYSGREINVIVRLAACDFSDDYEFKYDCLSDSQRRKVEDFFGKTNAYYTKHEIVKLYN